MRSPALGEVTAATEVRNGCRCQSQVKGSTKECMDDSSDYWCQKTEPQQGDRVSEGCADPPATTARRHIDIGEALELAPLPRCRHQDHQLQSSAEI